jgi:glycine/D-amino acid oxidase-like deaminating enzyme
MFRSSWIPAGNGANWNKNQLEGYTPDHAPLVGFLPGNENVIVMGGFSGHGFKFAPLMGRIASELVLSGETHYVITANEMYHP